MGSEFKNSFRDFLQDFFRQTDASKKCASVLFREEGETFVFPGSGLRIVLVPLGKDAVQKEKGYAVGREKKETAEEWTRIEKRNVPGTKGGIPEKENLNRRVNANVRGYSYTDRWKEIRKEMDSREAEESEKDREREKERTGMKDKEAGKQGFFSLTGNRSGMHGFLKAAEIGEPNVVESAADGTGGGNDRMRKAVAGYENEREGEKAEGKIVDGENGADNERENERKKENKKQEENERNKEPDILYLYEDRWRGERKLMEKRIGARLNCFRSVFARNCRVEDVGEYCRRRGATGTVERKKCVNEFNEKIRDFLERYHQYGYAKCRYKYLLFYGDEIVGAAVFSAGRPICRSIEEGPSAGKRAVFQSFEWVRYASLPDVRIVGGMGKILQAFLRERSREYEYVEVMTYSDNEWSAGKVYEKLGFRYAGEREPVEYFVNKKTWERFSRRRLEKAVFPITETGAETGLEVRTEIGTKTETETETRIGVEPGTSPETEIATGIDIRTGAETRTGIETGTDTGSRSETEIEIRIKTEMDTGRKRRRETKTGAGRKIRSGQTETASPVGDAASDTTAVINIAGGREDYCRIVNKGSRKFLLQRVTRR